MKTYKVSTWHEDIQGELHPFLISGEWSTSRSGRFIPRKNPVSTEQEAGWAPEPAWTFWRRGKYLVPKIIGLWILFNCNNIKVQRYSCCVRNILRPKHCSWWYKTSGLFRTQKLPFKVMYCKHIYKYFRCHLAPVFITINTNTTLNDT
jgi:hypothetical protein